MQQALLAEFEASGEQDGYVYEELSQDPWFVEQEPARIQQLGALGGVQ